MLSQSDLAALALDRCCQCVLPTALVCCGLGWCEDHWAEHDVAKHDYPEAPDGE